MMKNMEVRLCQFERGEDQKWDDYVYQKPSSSFCHLSVWKSIIEQTYGHKGWYFWALENNTVKGILPIISMKTLLFGRSLVSLPFLDEGDTNIKLRRDKNLHAIDQHSGTIP